MRLDSCLPAVLLVAICVNLLCIAAILSVFCIKLLRRKAENKKREEHIMELEQRVFGRVITLSEIRTTVPVRASKNLTKEEKYAAAIDRMNERKRMYGDTKIKVHRSKRIPHSRIDYRRRLGGVA